MMFDFLKYIVVALLLIAISVLVNVMRNKYIWNIRTALYSLSALLLLVFAIDQIFIVMEHLEWLGWGIFFGVSSLAIFVGMIYGLYKERNR